MIAPKLLPQYEYEPELLPSHKKSRAPRVARHATRRRKLYSFFAHYSNSAKVLIVLAMVLAPVMLYVMLTSRLTGLNYQLAAAESQKSHLQGEVQRLDDRIAYLESRERLAQVAAKLGMKDPSQYAIVALPAPPKPHDHDALALLSWLRR